jgi:hypothetical protein
MRIEFSLVGDGRELMLDTGVELFKDVVIKRDYGDLKIYRGQSLVFHTDSEYFMDFKGAYGCCSIERIFDSGIKDVVKNQAGEILFFVRRFIDIDSWNMVYSDDEVVPVFDGINFEKFYIRENVWRLFRPLKLTVVVSSSKKHDMLVMLYIAAFLWLKKEMSRHSG